MQVSQPQIAAAIATNFEGDAELYAAFASACDEQFQHDVEVGDAAAAAGDLQVLRRLAHDLKSAMSMLGCIDASESAWAIEQAADRGDLDATKSGWRLIRDDLLNSR